MAMVILMRFSRSGVTKVCAKASPAKVLARYGEIGRPTPSKTARLMAISMFVLGATVAIVLPGLVEDEDSQFQAQLVSGAQHASLQKHDA